MLSSPSLNQPQVSPSSTTAQAQAALRPGGWQLCVAPMIDVTDRHCRYFHRLLSPGARLYTEMISTGAILHGDRSHHLDFDEAEHPVAIQLGGSDPSALAQAARWAERWGYDEINLNCGCPSERVQKGAFGACLMLEPNLVADCLKAMQDAVDVPVTVKHRLGIDYNESYDFVRDFVGILYDAGCRVFIVHARNAVLKGLSPKENRQVPPLRYDDARRLKHDFPGAVFVLNGGIGTAADAIALQTEFDGVMLGRAAWHHPYILRDIQLASGAPIATEHRLVTRNEIIATMLAYAQHQLAAGVPLRFILRPMLGWLFGTRGARQWRQTLSDAKLLNSNNPQLLLDAWAVWVSKNPSLAN